MEGLAAARIVRTCLEYAGGVSELVALLHVIEGDAGAMRRVESIMAAIEALAPPADPAGARSAPVTVRDAGPAQ
jgi:Effector-associated domain 2